MIAEEIEHLGTNLRVKDYSNLIELQKAFIAHVSDKSYLSIVSLNYDDIIYDSVKGLGFENGFVNSRFDTKTFLQSDHVLSFPHGHVRFAQDSNGIIYRENPTISNRDRFVNLNISTLEETVYIQNSSYSFSFNTFIATGQLKEQVFDLNPFSSYYQRFASDCLHANKIFIIGYSFSDAHFNRMILDFLKFDSTNRIYVIDYLPYPVVMIDEFIRPGGLISNILRTFGITRLPLKNEKTYRYHIEEAKLNSNGYSEIFPQIYLYKGGYESFLRDYKTLLWN